MIKKGFFFIAIFIFLKGFTQQSFIVGYAPTYKGKQATLYSYSDLITYTLVKEASDTINEKGVFDLTTQVVKPTCYQVKIENKVAKLYMLTLYKYAITFPDPDSVNYHNPSTEEQVDLYIHGDSAELNARIIDFNIQFDDFWEKNYVYFVAKKLHNKLDSFQLKMEERYKNVKSNYFNNYMRYSFALINTNTGRHKNYIASKYLLNHPIEYYNYEYMDFFNQFFKNYLVSLSSGKLGNNLLGVINDIAQSRDLDQLLKNDTWLQNDSLRELVMLKGLYELYYSSNFDKNNIQSMIEQIVGFTKNEEHKRIGTNILRIFKNLQVGTIAPDFALKDISGKTFALSDFKNKFIYLNFFGLKSNESLQELKKLESIYKEYKNSIIIISVCTDNKSSDELKLFLTKNKNYKWLFLDAGSREDVLNEYVVKYPNLYYLINREGYFVQSPAKKPSEGIEFKFSSMFYPKRKMR
jgi:peroxiredoxin